MRKKALIEKLKILYGEAELDDLTAALDDSSLDTNLDVANEPLKPAPSKSSGRSNISATDTGGDFDLNISDDLNSLSDMSNSSEDSRSVDFEDIGDIPDLNIDDLDGIDGGVTEDVAANVNDDDIDGMISDLGNEMGLDVENDNTENPDETNEPDEDLDVIDTEDGEEDSPVSALSPDEEAGRKRRFIGILEKLYNIYGDKIKKFDTIQMPLDKERVYRPILDKYCGVYELLKEYILTKMVTDDSFIMMKRIVDFNTLFAILEHKLAMVNQWVKEMAK